jgi:hypothetical protein
MPELSRTFIRCSVVRLHCKERSLSANFGIVPPFVNVAETWCFLCFFYTRSKCYLCFSGSRLNDGSSVYIFSWFPMARSQIVSRFLPRHRCSLNVVYKMNLSDPINIFFICTLILQHRQYRLTTPWQKMSINRNEENMEGNSKTRTHENRKRF